MLDRPQRGAHVLVGDKGKASVLLSILLLRQVQVDDGAKGFEGLANVVLRRLEGEVANDQPRLLHLLQLLLPLSLEGGGLFC